MPVTFHRLTPIISCSSSPLNLCYTLTYESHSDPDRVGKIHLSFRGIPLNLDPPKEKTSIMKSIWRGEGDSAGRSGEGKIAVEI